VVLAFFAREFVYYAYSWAAGGKTPGMMLLGVQVVGQDGSHVGTRRGLVRALAFRSASSCWGWASLASCSGVIVARCMTSSPVPQLSTPGTRGRRGFGPSPASATVGGLSPRP
jgi:uncharacterized RDD family membrane protein YckC